MQSKYICFSCKDILAAAFDVVVDPKSLVYVYGCSCGDEEYFDDPGLTCFYCKINQCPMGMYEVSAKKFTKRMREYVNTVASDDYSVTKLITLMTIMRDDDSIELDFKKNVNAFIKMTNTSSVESISNTDQR